MKIADIEAILTDKKTSLENRFISACVLVNALRPIAEKGVIDANMQNKFYQYYKQGALGGDCRKEPLLGMLDYKAYKKWQVWDSMDDDDKNMSQEQAQEKYIDYALEVLEEVKKNEQAIKAIESLTSDVLKKLCEAKRTEIEKELQKHGKSLKKNDATVNTFATGTSEESTLASTSWTPSYSSHSLPSNKDTSEKPDAIASSSDNKDNVSAGSINNNADTTEKNNVTTVPAKI